MGIRDLHFTAADGYRLAATWFEPAGGDRTVLIASATAVPRQYYAKFANYLLGRGFRVLTFDYRGVGGSKPPTLRGFNARMRDWAALDLAAAVDLAAQEARRLLYVGHSFGGQALGLLPNNDKISRALFVAAQIGYWRLFPFPENYRVYGMLNFVGPAVARALGYIPGWLGIGEDLPGHVFFEWADWCMKPDYLFDDETLSARSNYPNYRGALRAIGISDDAWGPPQAVERLLVHYTGTRPEHVTIRPRDIGADKIGHFGFFREMGREKLWPEAADWLSR